MIQKFKVRFRNLLAAIEIAASIAFVWVPLWSFLPCYRRAGTECPPPSLCGIDSVEFAEGANLPAFAIVAPVSLVLNEYSHDEIPHDWVHDPFLRGFGYSLVGIVVWFFLGRLLDDFLDWRKSRIRPRIRIADLLFALATVVTSTLAATTLLTAAALERPQNAVGVWFAVWIVFWICVGYLGATMRVSQLIHARRESQPEPK